MPVDGKTFHKGYIDLVGARVDVFEDSDDNGDYFGFQVVEEYGLEGDGKGSGETQGHKLRLCSSHEEQRDQWCARRQPRLRWPLALPRLTSVGVAGRRVSYIKEASRPTWLDEGETKGDAKYKLCQCCEKKFGLKTRKSHCRRCGGVMCKKCTDAAELPAMMYEGPQKVCRQCSEGQYASRHIEKIPKKNRGTQPTQLSQPCPFSTTVAELEARFWWQGTRSRKRWTLQQTPRGRRLGRA